MKITKHTTDGPENIAMYEKKAELHGGKGSVYFVTLEIQNASEFFGPWEVPSDAEEQEELNTKVDAMLSGYKSASSQHIRKSAFEGLQVLKKFEGRQPTFGVTMVFPTYLPSILALEGRLTKKDITSKEWMDLFSQ